MLHGEIGRGGMAVVQRGYDEVLDRTVAVKLLHAHLAGDPAFLDRFRREARAAAALTHPNVVAVHDWGEASPGPFLVMQLVEGPSLREVLRRRGRLSPGETLHVVRAAAAGLAAAHAAGLVHRDVKPENLLIGRDGSLRVTDFGLARAVASATSTFGADVLVGSPHYLSPEAVLGDRLDPRADVYALGVVLFECLTGRRPHEGDSPYATAVQHTARPVPPPSTLVAELPAGIDEVVAVATAIDRDHRFADTGSLADALARVVGQAAVIDVDRPGTAFPDAQPPTTAASAEPGPPPPPTARSRPAPPPRQSDTRVVEPDERATEAIAADRPPRPHRPAPPPPIRGPMRRQRGWLVLLVVLVLVGASVGAGYLLWDRVLAPITPIPGVVGSAADDAVAELHRAGFGVTVDPSRRFDVAVPEGHVLLQSPAGTARQGHVVTLRLSAGPRQIAVPDVVGDPQGAAVQAIRAADLDPAMVEEYADGVAAGEVVRSDPPPGEVVDQASSVTLVVSRGPAPVEVPNLRGKRVDDAVDALDALGFDVEVERRGGFAAFLNPDRVYDQRPAPGTAQPRGTTVVLQAYEG